MRLPVMGPFDSIESALAALRQGAPVVVTDDANRENEGDLIVAAELVTEATAAFLIRHTSGVLCVGMQAEDLTRLRLPQMVPELLNSDSRATAFTVSVDAIQGTSTGISAADRARTIRKLADPSAEPRDFGRPGHVFPLQARPGGVLKRAGHTEAAVDLARLAGVRPAGLLAEVVNDDGTMSRPYELEAFKRRHGLRMISIAQLVEHRRMRDRIVVREAEARLPIGTAVFRVCAYRSILDRHEHLALIYGDIERAKVPLVRVHSECLTGDVLGSLRCDCGPQLRKALQMIEADGAGVLVYLRDHEGRGVGLVDKIKAYARQDCGEDTVDANVSLGLPVDGREYGIGAQILADLGVTRMRLLTNNPAKMSGLRGFGLDVVDRVPIEIQPHSENVRYLAVKRDRLGHLLAGTRPEDASAGLPRS